MITKRFKGWAAAAAALVVVAVTMAYAGDRMVRYTYGGATKFDLRSDGLLLPVALKRADNSSVTSATLPTTSTGSNYAIWLPVYNVGAAATAGDVLIASNTGTGYVMVAPASSNLTTVVGVAAEAIASGARGYMVARGAGYAVVHTTGTVAIGDILVTTSSASGYATGNSAPTGGAGFGTAMSAGTAAGGSVLAVLH